MNRKVHRLVLAGLLATATVTAGCASDDPDDEKSSAGDDQIVLGMAIAQSGPQTAYDQPPYSGVKLAVDEINAAGGVLGKEIKIVESDTKSEPQGGTQAAEEVIADGATTVIASCDYDYGSAAATAAQRANVVSWTICAESVKWGVEGIGDMTYSPSNLAIANGAIMADFAASKEWKDVAVLVDNTITFDEEYCGGFAQQHKANDGTYTRYDFQNGDPSISSQIAEIKSQDPDAIILCSYHPGGSSAVKQIRAAGLTTPIFGTDAFDGNYWHEGIPTEALNNFFYITFADVFGGDDRPEVQDFLEKYAAANDGAVPVTSYALEGYALVEMYVEAVERAGTADPEKVNAELMKFTDVPTLLGPSSFTEDVRIQLKRPMAILELVDGEPQWLGVHSTDADIELELLKS